MFNPAETAYILVDLGPVYTRQVERQGKWASNLLQVRLASSEASSVHTRLQV
jgi:hypothetical protein